MMSNSQNVLSIGGADFTPRRGLTLRFLAEPQHVNFGGKVHGGQVMKWIDQAAYACASGWCGRYCVTAYVGGIHFKEAIRIGDVVDVAAQIIMTGRTSMHIAVDVSARDPKSPYVRETTHCVLVFVGVDENAKPYPVPEWQPVSTRDIALKHYAVRLKELEASAMAERDIVGEAIAS
jgi:acyl-CoA hydrolase